MYITLEQLYLFMEQGQGKREKERRQAGVSTCVSLSREGKVFCGMIVQMNKTYPALHPLCARALAQVAHAARQSVHLWKKLE